MVIKVTWSLSGLGGAVVGLVGVCLDMGRAELVANQFDALQINWKR
jgi:hypothetical protein